VEKHNDPCIAPQSLTVAATETRLLQVTLELVVYSGSQWRVPLHAEVKPSKMRVVRIREVVPLAGDTKIERPTRASDERGSAAVSAGDQPAVQALGF